VVQREPAQRQLGNVVNVQVSEPVTHPQHRADPFQKHAAAVG